MNNNIVQIVKDVTPANREDLIRVLVNIQNILDSYFELHERLSKAPLLIKEFIETHGGNVAALEIMRDEVIELTKCVA